MTEYNETKGYSPMQLFYGGLGILGGIWLIIAPFVLNYGGATTFDAKLKKAVPVDLGAVTASDITVGVVLIALVGFALAVANNAAFAKARMYANIGVILAGIYLMAAPYLFDLLNVASYLTLDKPNTNDQLVGIVTVIVAGFAYQQQFLTTAETDETSGGELAPIA